MRELTKSIVDDGNMNAIDVTVGSRPLNCDNSYFGSYSHYGIHHEMLNVISYLFLEFQTGFDKNYF